MTSLQWILIVVAILAIVFIWRRVKQEAIRRIEGVLWTLVWAAVIVVVFQPSFSTRIANIFGVGRGADFVLIVAVAVLFLMVFQLYVAHQRLERSLTEFVRRQALQTWEEKRDKHV
jgi:hypothetical protein